MRYFYSQFNTRLYDYFSYFYNMYIYIVLCVHFKMFLLLKYVRSFSF